jgi:hypothetical protein
VYAQSTRYERLKWEEQKTAFVIVWEATYDKQNSVADQGLQRKDNHTIQILASNLHN